MQNLLIITLAVLFPVAVQAQPWSDDFDSYSNGQVLDGTADDGGWKGWDNNAGNGAPVTNLFSLSVPNSVQIRGGADLVHEYSVSGGTFSFIAWQYIPSSPELQRGTTYFLLLNEYSDGGPYSWSTQLAFNLTTGLLNDDLVAGDESMAIVFDKWVQIRVDFDLANDLQEVYYEGNLLSSDTWTHGDANAQLALEAVNLYANGADAVYYDSMMVVPEPGVLLVAGLGLMALLRRKR